MGRRGTIIALAVTSLAVAGAGLYRFVRHGVGEKPGDFPDGIEFVCVDASCGGRAALSAAQLDAHLRSKPDADPPCPTCGKPMARAVRCESCGKLVARPPRDGATACPSCGKRLVKPR